MPIEDYIASVPVAEAEEGQLDSVEDVILVEEDDMDHIGYTDIPALPASKEPLTRITAERPVLDQNTTPMHTNTAVEMPFRASQAQEDHAKPQLHAALPESSDPGPLPAAFFTGRGWSSTKKYSDSTSKPASFSVPKRTKTTQNTETREIAHVETPSLYVKAKENSASLPWFRSDPNLFSTASQAPKPSLAPMLPSDVKFSFNQGTSQPSNPMLSRYQMPFSVPKLSSPAPVFAPPPSSQSLPSKPDFPLPQSLDSFYGSALHPPTLFRDLQSLNSPAKPQPKALTDISNTPFQAESKPNTLLSSLDKLAYTAAQQFDDFESLFRDV